MDLQIPEALIGTSALYGMGEAMVAELVHPAAVKHIHHLAEETVYLDPTQALVLPRAPREEWEKAVTDAMMLEADRGVRQIKWRRSQNSGRPWVRPLMLPNAANAAIGRAKAAHGRGRRQGGLEHPIVLVTVSGRAMGPNPNNLWAAIVTKIESHIHTRLQENGNEVLNGDHRWVATRDPEGEWDGRARIQLNSMEEAKNIHGALHGMPIWTGVDWITVAISHAELPIAPPTRERGPGGPPVGETRRLSPGPQA